METLIYTPAVVKNESYKSNGNFNHSIGQPLHPEVLKGLVNEDETITISDFLRDADTYAYYLFLKALENSV